MKLSAEENNNYNNRARVQFVVKCNRFNVIGCVYCLFYTLVFANMLFCVDYFAIKVLFGEGKQNFVVNR